MSVFLTDGAPQPSVGPWVGHGKNSWSVMPELRSKGQNKCQERNREGTVDRVASKKIWKYEPGRLRKIKDLCYASRMLC